MIYGSSEWGGQCIQPCGIYQGTNTRPHPYICYTPFFGHQLPYPLWTFSMNTVLSCLPPGGFKDMWGWKVVCTRLHLPPTSDELSLFTTTIFCRYFSTFDNSLESVKYLWIYLEWTPLCSLSCCTVMIKPNPFFPALENIASWEKYFPTYFWFIII